MKTISLVIPCFNEEAAIQNFWDHVQDVTQELNQFKWEFVFIDDGSDDQTASIIRNLIQKEKKYQVKLIRFSRNFGKEAALIAGIRNATGDAVIPSDIDLQDPIHIVKSMIEEWQKGAQTVIGVRQDRTSDSPLKRLTAHLFYSIMSKIGRIPIEPHAGDFRLLDRKVVNAIASLTESQLFMKGVFAWAGFKATKISYVRETRKKGTSKFGFIKLLNQATDGIVSFSTIPLRIWFYVGLVISSLAFCYAFVLVTKTILWGIDAPGYASLMVAILFFGGLQLLALGIIGEYVAHTLAETKNRPPYIIESIHDNQKKNKKSL